MRGLPKKAGRDSKKPRRHFVYLERLSLTHVGANCDSEVENLCLSSGEHPRLVIEGAAPADGRWM